MPNKYDLFENQLKKAMEAYPHLRIKKSGGMSYLEGALDIKDEGDDVFATYLINIKFKDGFPYCFPILSEIGGDIPIGDDWHKYSDNSCCVTAPLIERLECIGGITVCKFIRDYAIPYFANQYHRKEFGYYKQEYAHGLPGHIQSYQDIFRSSNVDFWLEYVDYALCNKYPNIGRNSLCICGSGLKYKRCHNEVLRVLKTLDKTDLLKIRSEIIRLCLERKRSL